MNIPRKRKEISYKERIRRSASVTVICDVILILSLVICLVLYSSKNNVSKYNQNVDNITNIAAAKSGLMSIALNNAGLEVKNAYRFCDGKTKAEVLDYLATIVGQGSEYQLLKREVIDGSVVYTGNSTITEDGSYKEISYGNTALSKSIDSCFYDENGIISFSQTFTNKTDGISYFAAFCGLNITNGGESERYFLVKPQKEDIVLDQLYMYSQYSNLYTAVCYADGKYLAYDFGFSSDNFYEYLYRFNNLSVDQMNAIRATVRNDGDGVGALRYNDNKGRDCVFAYSVCAESNNWYVIVSVPVSNFITEKLLSFFPLIIIAFLAVLLLFNIMRLWALVRQLQLSVEREQVANKSKSSFLSRMSHEIRTPLNAIIGYNTIAKSEMLKARDENERRQAEMKVTDCLIKEETASKHLLTLINDVLDMSAIESGKIKVAHELFDFKGLISSLTAVFYSQAKNKGVDFNVIFNSLTEEWFVGDQVRTNQVLTNLLSNAIKFTPDGGKVLLRISQPEAGTNNSHIRFEVTDTGIGMTQEYLTHIWSPFEQADSSISRRFGGTGLGLSITKNLVDLMGGSITVESTPGKGSHFTVDLTYGRTEQPENNGIYDFGSVNALVVNDDPGACEYIRMLFERCGAGCTTVYSAADAIEAVKLSLSGDSRYGLYLIDSKLSDTDGTEAARRIRALAGNLPVIVMAVYDFSEIADKATENGINRFIAKPIFWSSLFDLLSDIKGIKRAETSDINGNVSFDNIRVLLAEDNSMNMEIAKRIMESAGLLVDTAWNGREAVTMFGSSPPGTYSAILMDIHMPEMNGHEATREIRWSDRSDAKTIPIIAMTADAFTENIEQAYAAGMNGLISKPIDTKVLFDTLKKFTGTKGNRV